MRNNQKRKGAREKKTPNRTEKFKNEQKKEIRAIWTVVMEENIIHIWKLPKRTTNIHIRRWNRVHLNCNISEMHTFWCLGQMGNGQQPWHTTLHFKLH